MVSQSRFPSRNKDLDQPVILPVAAIILVIVVIAKGGRPGPGPSEVLVPFCT